MTVVGHRIGPILHLSNDMRALLILGLEYEWTLDGANKIFLFCFYPVFQIYDYVSCTMNNVKSALRDWSLSMTGVGVEEN